MKLGLGTVQFGLNYGVSNSQGQTSLEEAKKIIQIASENKINILDTAPLYGNSEEVLGLILPAENSFNIITKTPHFSSKKISTSDVDALETTFHQSLHRLKKKSVDALLIHQSEDLLKEKGELLFKKMSQLKNKGLIHKIGVSVYTKNQIDQILESYPIDLIQLPLNVLDQRLIVSGHLKKLKKAGVEIHARSIFLQGLLLMDPSTLPTYFEPIRPQIESYYLEIQKYRRSKLEAALEFICSIEEIDVAIVAINNSKQFLEILSAIQTTKPSLDFSLYGINTPSMLDPSQWRL